eukprot:comp14588_c1_seq1/m.10855 comp14588_c1_seq1/g.10855  ORF comp14588_c1_seq1/g.10855 comp14588_c1_seq1/m.10855 type:complete len:226 (-) comp14588_c1_seq1:156-833(-)
MDGEDRLYFQDFTLRDEDGDTVVVKVAQRLQLDYGMYTWPCAPVLAQYVWTHRHEVTGKHVLELGAGTGLAGVAAAKAGGHVILTDADCEGVLGLARASCQANSVTCHVSALAWAHIPPLLSLPIPDIILAADCLYDQKLFDDFFCTVTFLLQRNPSAQLWMTYQLRSASRMLGAYSLRWGLSFTEIDVDDFFDPSLCPQLQGLVSVRMYIVTLADKKSSCQITS